MVLKIFISSVRNEFEEERMYLKQKLMEDSNLNKYIEIFLFCGILLLVEVYYE